MITKLEIVKTISSLPFLWKNIQQYETHGHPTYT